MTVGQERLYNMSIVGHDSTEKSIVNFVSNGPITIAIRARFQYDSSVIRARYEHDTLQHVYGVFRALAYEIDSSTRTHTHPFNGPFPGLPR